MTERQAEYVLRVVEERRIRFVQLWFTDVLGRHKAFHVTPAELEDALDEGMTFDGSAIDGFSRVQEADVLAKPDLDTFQLLPWHPEGESVARVFCDIFTVDGAPFQGCPRNRLRRVLDHARNEGYTMFVAPELEYFYFDSLEPIGPPRPVDAGSYFDLDTDDLVGRVRRDTVRTLEEMGIPVEHAQHEDAPSQHEIDLRYTDALTMADTVMTVRLVVKEMARQQGVFASFMPKPLAGVQGSGTHTHLSLFRDETNAFVDTDRPGGLSEVAEGFIAGLLRHAREISAVFAQWVNSYKRLVPGYEAPVYVAWSQRNRSALIRIPLYKPGSEQATRAEIRCPDPACNPYLTFASLLHAGLEGIARGYELAPPMETNLYHLTPEERHERGIVSLPETLGEAIHEFEGSELLRRAFGDHIFNNYARLKRQEWDEYRVQLTQWERDRYLSVL